MHIGILLTCHNRREITLRCLDRLAACDVPDGAKIHTILVDDGSTDGTANAVAERHPSVEILRGDGSLFWAGGTRLAMLRAVERELNAFVWLNDDVVLDRTALADLVDTYEQVRESFGPMSIVVGSMRDPDTGETTYGGVRQMSSWHPLKFEIVEPTDAPQRCHAMNGNLVFIPAEVVDQIGVLSDEYVHGIGDFGYGFEARDKGATVWVCPGHQGSCRRNDPSGSWQDPTVPIMERFRKLAGPKGLPASSYARFLRLAGARWTWPAFLAMPYLRVVVTSLRARLTGDAH